MVPEVRKIIIRSPHCNMVVVLPILHTQRILQPPTNRFVSYRGKVVRSVTRAPGAAALFIPHTNYQRLGNSEVQNEKKIKIPGTKSSSSVQKL